MYHCGELLGRVGLGVIVINGIEAALWDLKGKMLGLPVHELLGGAQARLTARLRHRRTVQLSEGAAREEDRLLPVAGLPRLQGRRRVSSRSGATERRHYMPMRPAEAADFEGDKVALPARARRARTSRIMLDGHMGNNDRTTWTLDIAKAVMKAVEPYDLFFFEEPLHYTDPWGYAELCARHVRADRRRGVPHGAVEWRVFVEQDSFDIGQPDAAFTGGHRGVPARRRDAGGRAAARSPRTPGRRAVGFMQNLHCGFAAANTAMLEIAPALRPACTRR